MQEEYEGLEQSNKYPGVFYRVFTDFATICAYIVFSGRSEKYAHLNNQRIIIIDNEFSAKIPDREFEDDEELCSLFDSNEMIPTDYWKSMEEIDFDIYPGNTTVYLKEAGFHSYRDFKLPKEFRTPEYFVRYRLCKTKTFNDDVWIVTRTNTVLSISQMNERYGFELKEIYKEFNEMRKPDVDSNSSIDDLPY